MGSMRHAKRAAASASVAAAAGSDNKQTDGRQWFRQPDGQPAEEDRRLSRPSDDGSGGEDEPGRPGGSSGSEGVQDGSDGGGSGEGEGDVDDDLLLSSDELDERLGLGTGGGAAGTAAAPGPLTALLETARAKRPHDQRPANAEHGGDGAGGGAGALRKRGRPAEGSGDGDGSAELVADESGGEDGGGASARVGGPEAKKRRSRKVLDADELTRANAAAERRGVVYVSRIPPAMKPGKLRQLLSVHGEIGRLYCAPTDKPSRADRKKAGKPAGGGKSFSEGWVEFEDKRVAKRVAAQLNGTQIGGRRRSKHYYDLWCLKYLSKFKWDHLTEEINYARAVREQRLAAEISSAKRERDFYLSRVDRAKAVDAMRERKAAKADAEGGNGANTTACSGKAAEGGERPAAAPRGRFFRQVRARPDVLDDGAAALDDDVLALVGGRGRR